MDTQDKGSGMMWYVIGLIALVAIAAWYFYTPKAAAPTTSPSQAGAADTSTTALNQELNQIPDNSAELNQAAAAAAADVSSF